MHRTPFLLHDIDRLPPDRWQALLARILARANQVRIYLPGKDLEPRQPQVLALPEIAVTPWEGMMDAQVATAAVTREIRRLLTRSRLWSYELFAGAEPLLRVEDFSQGFLWLTTAELAELQALGLHPPLLEPADLQPHPGVQPVAMSGADLSGLAMHLEKLRSVAKPEGKG